jgi:hypothetical protein
MQIQNPTITVSLTNQDQAIYDYSQLTSFKASLNSRTLDEKLEFNFTNTPKNPERYHDPVLNSLAVAVQNYQYKYQLEEHLDLSPVIESWQEIWSDESDKSAKLTYQTIDRSSDNMPQINQAESEIAELTEQTAKKILENIQIDPNHTSDSVSDEKSTDQKPKKMKEIVSMPGLKIKFKYPTYQFEITNAQFSSANAKDYAQRAQTITNLDSAKDSIELLNKSTCAPKSLSPYQYTTYLQGNDEQPSEKTRYLNRLALVAETDETLQKEGYQQGSIALIKANFRYMQALKNQHSLDGGGVFDHQPLFYNTLVSIPNGNDVFGKIGLCLWNPAQFFANLKDNYSNQQAERLKLLHEAVNELNKEQLAGKDSVKVQDFIFSGNHAINKKGVDLRSRAEEWVKKVRINTEITMLATLNPYLKNQANQLDGQIDPNDFQTLLNQYKQYLSNDSDAGMQTDMINKIRVFRENFSQDNFADTTSNQKVVLDGLIRIVSQPDDFYLDGMYAWVVSTLVSSLQDYQFGGCKSANDRDANHKPGVFALMRFMDNNDHGTEFNDLKSALKNISKAENCDGSHIQVLEKAITDIKECFSHQTFTTSVYFIGEKPKLQATRDKWEVIGTGLTFAWRALLIGLLAKAISSILVACQMIAVTAIPPYIMIAFIITVSLAFVIGTISSATHYSDALDTNHTLPQSSQIFKEISNESINFSTTSDNLKSIQENEGINGGQNIFL